MLILMDVDGVVAGFTDYLLYSIGSEKRLEDITTWRIQDHVTASQWEGAKAWLSDFDWWGRIPVMPGAQDAIADIKARGHEIHWVTSPWWICFGWESEPRKWLHEHFGAKYNEVTFTYRKDLVRGDVLIDDNPEHVRDWATRNLGWWDAVLFDAPYNQDSSYGKRMDWSNYAEVLF